jgi:hypothetical protein
MAGVIGSAIVIAVVLILTKRKGQAAHK